MRSHIQRRDFLKLSAVAAVLPVTMPAHATDPAVAPVGISNAVPRLAVPQNPGASAEGLMVYQHGPQISIRWDNRLLTCYRAHPTQKYPYLYPLIGPASGQSLTDEAALPWPNHQSVFFGCDRVNGGNFWEDDMNKGQVLSSGPRIGTIGKASVEILDDCNWRKPGGPTIMQDQRKITVTLPSQRLRLLDFDILWQAVETITVQKSNHALFAIRAARDIVPAGGGNLLNADGDAGEKGTFGRKSPWCGFFGRRATPEGGTMEGIALLDHPKNPWSPCPWFTRDYGFASPMPMNFMENAWTLPAGEAVRLRYRVVLHTGDHKEAGIAALYQEWAV